MNVFSLFFDSVVIDVSTQKRVSFFIPSLRGGGAERMTVNIANALAGKGYAVDLVLSKAEGPYLDIVREDVRIVDLGTFRVSSSLPGLVSYLKKNKPEVLLSAMSHANIVAVIAKIIAMVPTRVYVSERNNVSTSLKGLGWFKRFMLIFLMKVTYTLSARVVAISKGAADDLSSRVGIKRCHISVVYNPAFSERMFHDIPAAPHSWLIDKDVPVIIGIGRLSLEKNFSLLIRAFSEVVKTRKARLVILGEGNERASLESLITDLDVNDVVDLPGFTSSPESYLSRASLFVLSSDSEGFGNVLVEAMGSGVPIVSTNCPSGPSEILENGKWGKLVPPGDAEALSGAILETLDQNEFPDVKTRAKDFGIDAAVDGYLNVFFS